MPTRRLRPLRYPARIEARYRRELLAYTQDMRDTAAPGLDAILRDPRWRQDTLSEDFVAILQRIKALFSALWSPNRVKAKAKEIFDSTNEFHAAAFQREYSTVLPIQAIGAEWEAGQAASFIAENVALIKSIDSRYFAEIEATVHRAVADGMRVEELRDILQARYGIARGRATLIARDQMGKVVGRLTRQRQLAAGVDQAEWVTSRDERVRRTHREVDGVVYDLADGTTVGGNSGIHPGQEIQCRCTSAPVVEF